MLKNSLSHTPSSLKKSLKNPISSQISIVSIGISGLLASCGGGDSKSSGNTSSVHYSSSSYHSSSYSSVVSSSSSENQNNISKISFDSVILTPEKDGLVFSYVFQDFLQDITVQCDLGNCQNLYFTLNDSSTQYQIEELENMSIFPDETLYVFAKNTSGMTQQNGNITISGNNISYTPITISFEFEYIIGISFNLDVPTGENIYQNISIPDLLSFPIKGKNYSVGMHQIVYDEEISNNIFFDFGSPKNSQILYEAFIDTSISGNNFSQKTSSSFQKLLEMDDLGNFSSPITNIFFDGCHTKISPLNTISLACNHISTTKNNIIFLAKQQNNIVGIQGFKIIPKKSFLNSSASSSSSVSSASSSSSVSSSTPVSSISSSSSSSSISSSSPSSSVSSSSSSSSISSSSSSSSNIIDSISQTFLGQTIREILGLKLTSQNYSSSAWNFFQVNLNHAIDIDQNNGDNLEMNLARNNLLHSKNIIDTHANDIIIDIQWSLPTQRENGDVLHYSELGGYEIRFKHESLNNWTYHNIDTYKGTQSRLGLPRNLLQNGTNISQYTFEIAVYDTNGLYSNFVQVTPKN